MSSTGALLARITPIDAAIACGGFLLRQLVLIGECAGLLARPAPLSRTPRSCALMLAVVASKLGLERERLFEAIGGRDQRAHAGGGRAPAG